MKDPQGADYSDESSGSLSASQSGDLELNSEIKENLKEDLRTALVSTGEEGQKETQEQKKIRKSIGDVDINPDDAAADGGVHLRLSRRLVLGEATYWILSILTLGVLPLIDFWLEGELFGRFAFREVGDFDSATHVRVRGGRSAFVKLHRGSLALLEGVEVEASFFRFNERLFFWSEAKRFESLFAWRNALPASTFASRRNGLADSDVSKLAATYGANDLRVPRAQGAAGLLFSPFGIFAATASLLLFIAGLRSYALAFVIISIGRFVAVLRRRGQRLSELQKDSMTDNKVVVIRRSGPGLFHKRIVDSRELVPGDLVEISSNTAMPADVLLTHGAAVIAEPVGVSQTKRPFPADSTCTLGEVDPRHVLPTGSQVKHTLAPIEGGCFGLVLRTGWATAPAAATRAALRRARGRRPADATTLLFCLAACALLTSAMEAALGGVGLGVARIAALALCPLAPVALALAAAAGRWRLGRKGVDARRETDVVAAAEAKIFVLESTTGTGREKAAGYILTKTTAEGAAEFEKLLARRSRLVAAAGDSARTRRFIEVLGLTNSLMRVGEEVFGCPAEAERLRSTPLTLQSRVGKAGEIERFFACDTPGFSSRYDAVAVPAATGCVAVDAVDAEGRRFTALIGDPSAVSPLCVSASVPKDFESAIMKLAGKGLRIQAIAAREAPSGQFELLGLYCASGTAPAAAFAEVASEAGGRALILMSQAPILAAVAAGRRGGLLPTGTKVLAIDGKFSDTGAVVVGAEISRKPTDISTPHAPLDEKTVVAFEGTLAITGAGLKAMQSVFSSNGFSMALEKARIFAELDEAGRVGVLRALDEEVGPVCYVFSGEENSSAGQAASVCVSVGGGVSTADIRAPAESLDSVAALLAESRSAAENKQRIAALTLVFLGLRLLTLLVLVGKRTSFSTSQAILLDFGVLLGLAAAQAFCANPTPAHRESTRIYSKRFLLGLAPLLAFFAGVTLFGMALLAKAKFYDPPKALFGKGSKPRGPDFHFFFDPFVATMFVGFLIAFQSLSSNLRSILRPRESGKIMYFAYWTALFAFLSVILFRPARMPGSGVLARLFRAPMLFGFEIIIAALLIASALVILLFKKFGPKQTDLIIKTSPETLSLADRASNDVNSKRSVSHSSSVNASVSEVKERKIKNKNKKKISA